MDISSADTIPSQENAINGMKLVTVRGNTSVA